MTLRAELEALLLPVADSVRGRVGQVMFGGLGQCCLVFEDGRQRVVRGERDWTPAEIRLAKEILQPSGHPPLPRQPPIGPRPDFTDSSESE